MKINSLEYESWHEVGHALICLHLGGRVHVIEKMSAGDSIGSWRTRCERDPKHRKSISCGGFAAEYILYKDGRLSGTNAEFESASTKNAQLDMFSFLELDYKDPDKRWPPDEIKAFKAYAIKNIVPILEPQKHMLKKLAKKLASKKKLEEEYILNILSSRGFRGWICQLFK